MRALLLVLSAGLLLSACGAGTSAPREDAVQVSVTSCGVGWTPTHAGPQHIIVHNTDSRSGEAQLIDARTKAVFADVEPLGAGTTTGIDVSLGAGRYAWRCLMEDEAAVYGRTVQLTGTAHGTTPGVRPVSAADLIGATQAYQRYVSGQLPRLARDVSALRRDLSDRAKAETDWLVAHLEYERLGAAYDAFGELDGVINGRPTSAAGVRDPRWTGFHRIEYGLWHGESPASLSPHVDRLGAAINQLRHQFATAQLDPGQLAIRAHEISENALQFELTGQSDFGSHSELATVQAELDGTVVVLKIVHALIAPRYHGLAAAEALLHQTQLDITDHAAHDRIDADVSQLCELLAPVASILEPRKTG